MGTNINIQEIVNKFRNFLLEFKLEDDSNLGGEIYYLKMLKEIKITKIYILNIDSEHIKKYDESLYWQLP